MFIFLKRKLHIYILKAYVVKLERNYVDIWGFGGESPQKPATFQRKLDVYFFKKKASYIYIYIYLKAYVGNWKEITLIYGGLGRESPEASDMIKWKPDIYLLKRKFHFF